jgi:hypothetical protein
MNTEYGKIIQIMPATDWEILWKNEVNHDWFQSPLLGWGLTDKGEIVGIFVYAEEGRVKGICEANDYFIDYLAPGEEINLEFLETRMDIIDEMIKEKNEEKDKQLP